MTSPSGGTRRGAWTLLPADGADEDGRDGFTLVHDGGTLLEDCIAGTDLPEGVRAEWDVSPGPTPDWLRLTVVLRNESPAPLPLDRPAALACRRARAADAPFTRALCEARAMVDHSALLSPADDVPRVAEGGVVGFAPTESGNALVIGFASFADAFAEVAFTLGADGPRDLRAACLRENIPLAPGATLALPPLLIGAGEGLAALMDRYAVATAREMGGASPRAAESPARIGWCSWYHYYGTETETDILENVRALAASPMRDAPSGGGPAVIQIDDGWNLPAPGHPRVWGDWEAGAKFPRGMRVLADDIKAAGFVPGLWLAPFSVDPASRLRREHPDWLVQDADGTGPADYWGVHALDLTHPDALGFVGHTFRRVFDDWGFDYVKIDFLVHAVQPGRRRDRTLTAAAAYRRGLEVIRRAAGPDRFVLCCGAPLGASLGLCDGMRIGYDVSSRWSVPMNPDSWPDGNCCVRAAALQTIRRQWMHGRWWQNDPDCLVVRDHGTPPETAMFAELFGGAFASEPPYGLTGDEAGLWCRLVWMTGGMALASERVAELESRRPDRAALLWRSLRLPRPRDVRWIDHYADPDLCFLRGETADGVPLVAAFNLGDHAAAAVRLPETAVGIGAPPGDRAPRELWGDQSVPGVSVPVRSGGHLLLPPLAPRSGRVWEIP